MSQKTGSAEPEPKFLIRHVRKECIGCGACAAITPEFWVMDEENLSHLKGSRRESNVEFLDIESKNFEANLEAAESCPVNCIHIIDKKEGKEII